MRIALFTYGTQARGGVVHTLALGEALQDLGYDACVYALDAAGGAFHRQPRCPCVLLPVEPGHPGIVGFVRVRIEAYVRALQGNALSFDVYHAQDGISGNALATLVTSGAVPRFVRTVHHMDDFAQTELLALQDRAIVTAASHFVVSERWRKVVRERYGIDAAVVANGVDLERFAPVTRAARARLRERLGFGSRPHFLSIGGVEARKNTIGTLEAFALVRAARPDARLVVAGGASVFDHGAYRRTFEARAAQLGLRLGEDVIDAGIVSDETIVDLLRAADAFVFPSFVEGFGLVLLEALACATPVVTSATRPFSEFLSERDAILVDPHDSTAIATGMRRALEPSIARELGARGLQIAQHYSWAASAQAHLSRYHDVAARAKERVRA